MAVSDQTVAPVLDAISAAGVGVGLLVIVWFGNAPRLWELIKHDGPGFAKWGFATALLWYLADRVRGPVGGLIQMFIFAAGVGFAVANGPTIAQQFSHIYGDTRSK